MTAVRKLDYDSYNNAPQPHLENPKPRSKPKAKKKRVPECLVVLTLACVCVALCLLYLDQKVKTMHLNVEIGQLEQELEKLYEENAHLVLELESVQRLTYIEAVARGQLGMVEPENASLLVMSGVEQQRTPQAPGWVGEEESQNPGIFVMVAEWLNQVLPIGGVEAGRIGR